MSKKSRRRNRALGVIAGLMGAKALGVFGKTPVGSSGVVGKTPEFRKSFVKDKKFTKPVGPQKVNTKMAPGIKVNYKGEVIKKGVNTGVGNEKTKFVNLSPDKGEVGIYKGGKKVSDLNPKAINVLSDGKISSQGKIFDGKKEYRKFMDEKRALKKKTSLSKKTNKKNPGLFGFTFDKPLFKKGSMIKARGGGMARTKPTKMY